jgi:hypothetical protein
MVGGDRGERVIRDSPIIVGELSAFEVYVSDEIMVGAITLTKVMGSDIPPAREKTNLTSPAVIMGVVVFLIRGGSLPRWKPVFQPYL